MSLNYRHFLIPRDCSFRPEAAAVASFLQGCIDAGAIGEPAQLAVGQLRKEPQEPKEMVNPFTGEVAKVTPPSRRPGEMTELASATELGQAASEYAEYDAWVSSSTKPRREPLVLGVAGDQGWEPFEDDYHLAITCHVRACPVYLSHYETLEDVGRPFDASRVPAPRMDEDSGDSPVDGVFEHPELGAFVVKDAGSASFWIELAPGKFLHPIAEGGGLAAVEGAFARLAEECFGVKYVQVCLWG